MRGQARHSCSFTRRSYKKQPPFLSCWPMSRRNNYFFSNRASGAAVAQPRGTFAPNSLALPIDVTATTHEGDDVDRQLKIRSNASSSTASTVLQNVHYRRVLAMRASQADAIAQENPLGDAETEEFPNEVSEIPALPQRQPSGQPRYTFSIYPSYLKLLNNVQVGYLEPRLGVALENQGGVFANNPRFPQVVPERNDADSATTDVLSWDAGYISSIDLFVTQGGYKPEHHLAVDTLKGAKAAASKFAPPSSPLHPAQPFSDCVFVGRWSDACYERFHISRKHETDHDMTYLARVDPDRFGAPLNQYGFLSWRFDLQYCFPYVPKALVISASYQLYHGASVEWMVRNEDDALWTVVSATSHPSTPNGVFSIDMAKDCASLRESFYVACLITSPEATAINYQYAQLFRQATSDRRFDLSIHAEFEKPSFSPRIHSSVDTSIAQKYQPLRSTPTDLTIRSSSAQFPFEFSVHRKVLEERSDYFAAALTNFSERSAKEMTVEGGFPLAAHIWMRLISWMYTDVLEIEAGMLYPLLQTAHMYSLAVPVDRCVHFIFENVSEDNLQTLGQFVSSCPVPELVELNSYYEQWKRFFSVSTYNADDEF